MTRLFLFDIAAYLHRAMYVTYGDRCAEIDPNDDAFIKHACGMLANTMMTLDVQRMVVVCDSAEPSLRCDEYPAYKAERKAHYPVFAKQAPRFFDALQEVSVPVLAAPRYEADDLIASMLGPAYGDPDGYVIVSSDKDLLAHVDADLRVKFYDPMKAAWFGPSDVREKFGVEASQLYDYIGLVGDTADGIPGVPGFGAKTVAKLLRDFDSLDEIYSEERRFALSETLGKKKLETLLAHKDEAFLSRRLASPRICMTCLDKDYPDETEEVLFDAPTAGIVRKACG